MVLILKIKLNNIHSWIMLYMLTKNINLFVQRQDPDDVGHIRHASRFPTDAETNKLTNAKENNYYQEEDIEC